MRSVGHWRGVLRAWAALVLAVAHLLLMLSTTVAQAASFSLVHSLDGAICLPGGSGDSPEAPAEPVNDHRGDCCVSCAAFGPFAATPSALDAAAIDLVSSDTADRAYAAPFLCDLFDGLSGSPRAPPGMA